MVLWTIVQETNESSGIWSHVNSLWLIYVNLNENIEYSNHNENSKTFLKFTWSFINLYFLSSTLSHHEIMQNILSSLDNQEERLCHQHLNKITSQIVFTALQSYQVALISLFFFLRSGLSTLISHINNPEESDYVGREYSQENWAEVKVQENRQWQIFPVGQEHSLVKLKLESASDIW